MPLDVLPHAESWTWFVAMTPSIAAVKDLFAAVALALQLGLLSYPLAVSYRVIECWGGGGGGLLIWAFVWQCYQLVGGDIRLCPLSSL